MKYFLVITMTIFSFGAFSSDVDEKLPAKIIVIKPITKTKTKVGALVKAKPAVAPCDSKEDLLKKIKEKEKIKAETEKPHGFSLQGGDTGCSVK